MAEKLNPKETVSLKEVVMSNVYTQEALVNLLEEKGVLTKKEVIEEIVRIDKANKTKS